MATTKLVAALLVVLPVGALGVGTAVVARGAREGPGRSLAAPRSGARDKEDEPKRLTPPEAAKVIAEYLRGDRRAPLGLDKLTVKELTTDEVWKKLRVQLFTLDRKDGVPLPDSFVVRKNEAFPLHNGLSGFRLRSFCVASLRRGGGPVLAFSYTWGSGVWRSQVAVFDATAKEPKPVVAPQSLVLDPAHDWVVKPAGGRKVRVEGGSVEFGELLLEEKDGKATARVRLRADLPASLRKRIQEITRK